MRARKKKNTFPRLTRVGAYITERIVSSGKPVHVEIGSGKGAFALYMAQHTDCDYYALEKIPDVMVMAAEKAAAAEVKNLHFLLADAQQLPEICPDETVDVLYLNFSDPWPKRRDLKKRLTYISFLNIYKRILKPDGIIRIKTDNAALFEFSVRQLRQAGFALFDLTNDLHNSGIVNECMTEYETRFASLGQPIYSVKAKKIEGGIKMILKNAKVYNADFDLIEADVQISGDKIAAVGPCCDGETLDLHGLTILPGLIDIHIHGCGGADTGDATPQALEAMSQCLVKRGVTSFCPTSMTLSFEELSSIFANVEQMRERVGGAYIQGINMEGPYISMAKKGAQNALYVRNPDKDEFRRLYEGCNGVIKIVDIAPECDGADSFIEEVTPYCPVSIAHTACGYDEAVRAIELGVRHITHLYNAQSGLVSRAPGVVGAAFDKAQEYGVRAELICDGFHIHPASLRIAFRMLGEDGSIVISDSMRAAGHHDGEYDLGGQTVYVKDGKALLADGTIAASTSNIWQELKNIISYGVPVKQAIKSCTINPAKAIRVDNQTGSIEVGKFADLLVVDDEWNIKLVIVKGEIKVNNL